MRRVKIFIVVAFLLSFFIMTEIYEMSHWGLGAMKRFFQKIQFRSGLSENFCLGVQAPNTSETATFPRSRQEMAGKKNGNRVLYHLLQEGYLSLTFEYEVHPADLLFPRLGLNITVNHSKIGLNEPVDKQALLSSPESGGALCAIYRSVFNKDEKALYLLAYQIVVNTFVRNKILFFISAGTLLGSYRSHAINPWDIDMDITVSNKDIDRAYDTLQNVSGFNVLNERCMLRFFADGFDTFVGMDYKWPNVDIYTYVEENGWIWDACHECSAPLCFRRSTIFPLIKRPLEGLMLPAPCDTERVLKAYYNNLDTCISPRTRDKFNLKNEPGTEQWMSRKIECHKLNHIVPFVIRSIKDNRTLYEELKLGNQSLGRKIEIDICHQ